MHFGENFWNGKAVQLHACVRSSLVQIAIQKSQEPKHGCAQMYSRCQCGRFPVRSAVPKVRPKKEDVHMSASTIQYDAISTSHTASASLVRANTPLFSALSPVFVETPSLWDSTGAALPEHLHQKDNEGQRKRTGLECGPPFPPRES